MANYMCQAQQKWTLTAVPNAGGYPGSPYFKITVAGTDRALAATELGELVVLPAFTGGPEQLWRWTSSPTAPGASCRRRYPTPRRPWRFRQSAASNATLSKFDPAGNKQRWLLKTP